MRCAARPSYVYAGGGTKPPISAASRRANSIVVRSSPSDPMICRPTGNPSLVKPIGAAVAGRYDKLASPAKNNCSAYGTDLPLTLTVRSSRLGFVGAEIRVVAQFRQAESVDQSLIG